MTITQGNVYVTLQGTNVIEAHQDGVGCAVKINTGAHLYFSVDSNDPDGSILLHGTSLYGGGSAAVEGGNLHINGGTVSLVGGNKILNSYGSSFTGESLDLQGGVLNFSAGSSENLNLSGGSIDVSGSLTVGPNAEFHIPSDSVVTILNDASLTNDGTITNHGTVTNEGTITNSGTINGAGTLTGNGTLNGSKVLPAVTPPTAANDLSFTGTEYELISAGSTNGGTMQYSLSPDAGYSTEIPTGTDAGTYLVYYKVVGNTIYADVEAQSITVTIRKATQSVPSVSIHYTNETLSTTAEMEYSTDGGTSWTRCSADMAADALSWSGTAAAVQFRMAENVNYSASEVQRVSIPARPAAPAEEILVHKTENAITVTNASAFSGCEFSADGTNWQDSAAFTGLSAGQTYTLSVREKAAASSFASASKSKAVTTVNGDGSTTLRPGESVGSGGNTITNDGEKITIIDGGTTTTITPPTTGEDVTIGGNGGVTVPGGSAIEKPDGTTVTVPSGGGTFDPGTGEVTQNVYTVTFDSQGGSSVSSSQVTGGSKVTKPATPSRSGYTFGGWYKDSGCTNAWNFDIDTVTGDMTLYAKWTKNNNSSGGSGSYTPPTYPPTVERPSEGGSTATVSPSRPERGDTVTVTPRPDAGYEVDKITVTDQNGRPVEVTVGPDGTYTFTQPTGKVKIEVTYKPTQPAKTPWSNPFADVAEDDWYYEAVRLVHERGLMDGYSDSWFGPNDSLSRAQLAQILFNKEGGPVVNYLMEYSDVTGEAWYAEAVRWATSQGIVGGYGNGTFGPNDPITREQLAVMLWRYSGSPAATNKELHLNDTDEINGFALEALRWAVENGILNGCGDGRLGPQGLATRAQVAQMLKNFLENRESGD